MAVSERSIRVIMHVDLDHFYSQCEELRNSTLRDKPVVVCVFSGRTEVSGVVSTGNYIARRFGVKSGMPIAFAKRLLGDRKDAVFLPMDRDYYEKVSSSAMTIIRGFADSFEQTGIDEAFLDVGKRSGGNFEETRKLAVMLKSQLLQKEGVTCSIGIGPNKLVAKIASDYHKPNGLTVVRSDEVATFLSPLPVGKLYGVGKKTEKVMKDLGIATIGDLTKFDVDRLVNVFGKSLGKYFYLAARGVDEDPLVERESREQFSRIITLKENTKVVDVMLPEIDRIARDLHQKLVKGRISCRSIGIIVIDEALKQHTRSTTTDEPISDLLMIRKTAEELFRGFFHGGEYKARRIGLKLFNLSAQMAQSTLSDFLDVS